MGRLQMIFDLGAMPEGLEPLFDDAAQGGNGMIYGVSVMTSHNGLTRADIIDYPGFWQVMEVEMPLGLTGARSWKFSRVLELVELVERVRAWGLDRDSAPEGWEWEYVAGEYKRHRDGEPEPPAGIYILGTAPITSES